MSRLSIAAFFGPAFYRDPEAFPLGSNCFDVFTIFTCCCVSGPDYLKAMPSEIHYKFQLNIAFPKPWVRF